RKLVGADLAQNEPALGEEGIRLFRRFAFGFGKVDQNEIRRAWRHSETELPDLLGQPGEPTGIVRAGAVDVGGVANGGDACGNRGRVDVEWSADAIDRVDGVCGTIHPAQAERRKPVDL